MIQPDFFLTCGGHLRQKGYQTSSVMACSRKTCWRYASIATLEIFDLVQLMYVPLETLMQMLLQLLDILHYCINLVIPDYSSFHRRGTFDISKKPVSLHSTSSKKLVFVGILHSSSKSSDRLFSQHCFTPRKLHVFFPNFRGTFRVFGRSLGGVLGLNFTMYTNFKLVNLCVSLIN